MFAAVMARRPRPAGPGFPPGPRPRRRTLSWWARTAWSCTWPFFVMTRCPDGTPPRGRARRRPGVSRVLANPWRSLKAGMSSAADRMQCPPTTSPPPLRPSSSSMPYKGVKTGRKMSADNPDGPTPLLPLEDQHPIFHDPKPDLDTLMSDAQSFVSLVERQLRYASSRLYQRCQHVDERTSS